MGRALDLARRRYAYDASNAEMLALLTAQDKKE